MSNVNDDRLKRLKARVEGAGFEWVPDTLLPNIVEICVSPHGVGAILQINTTIPENIDTAHALLDGLSLKRGPVVKVDGVGKDGGCSKCNLYIEGQYYVGCKFRWSVMTQSPDSKYFNRATPGPGCPIHSKPGDDYEARIVWMPKEVK